MVERLGGGGGKLIKGDSRTTFRVNQQNWIASETDSGRFSGQCTSDTSTRLGYLVNLDPKFEQDVPSLSLAISQSNHKKVIY